MAAIADKTVRRADRRGVFVRFALLVALSSLAVTASANDLNELSLEGWKQLREVERYQLQIAEKYFREQNWKIAAAEYEKFMSLYEDSTGAAYAQLKWSLAQCQLRKQNTAIKEGFQSVIDYWPDSPQATAAAYYIGRTYKDIGRVAEAKKALRDVVMKQPQHLAAVLALTDLVEIAQLENDVPARVELWKRLTFDIPRGKDSNSPCVLASQQLANHQFREAAFDEGVKALATTYKNEQLAPHVHAYVRTPLSELASQSETKAKADQLANAAIAWFKQAVPADLSTPEAKQQARQLGLAQADLLALAKRDEQIPAFYEQLLTSLGADDEVLGRFAAWHKAKGQFDPARDVYRRYANKVEGLGQVANSYREQQNTDAAVAAYNQALGLDPEQKIRWKSEIATTYRNARKFPEAIGMYEELYKDDLNNANRWRWEVASAYRDAGQLKEAIGNFRQCDNFPENYKQMAWCHRQLKEPKEAIILYNQVASDAGSAAWAMLQVAYTREEAGEQEPAIQAFQQVCKKFPKDQHASVAHAHLQQKYKISVTLGGATDE